MVIRSGPRALITRLLAAPIPIPPLLRGDSSKFRTSLTTQDALMLAVTSFNPVPTSSLSSRNLKPDPVVCYITFRYDNMGLCIFFCITWDFALV